MNYVLSFIAAFALTAGVAAWARISASERPEAETATQPDTHEGHKDMVMGEEAGENKSDEKKDEKKPAEKKEEPKKDETPKWDAEVTEDLKNAKDPVDEADVNEQGKVTVVYYGLKVHFNSEDNQKAFKKSPHVYVQRLSLELLDGDGHVKKVDASAYVNAAPENCPICGMEIDADGDVFILHRGFRVFFGCWGCWKKFLAEPTKYYDAWGLEEKDGKLVKKS